MPRSALRVAGSQSTGRRLAVQSPQVLWMVGRRAGYFQEPRRRGDGGLSVAAPAGVNLFLPCGRQGGGNGPDEG